ncbi:uncharacterized protein LOC105643367 isoform X2 [Jatropha curcas]|uniref:uncharacterized protein LOC105643367 isoform X2 n=1 Tax=Jatropha curcas TaxID=180498 RepID=UPI00189393A5|nr:uncharacterized protein LOC105643367 isoform X2 [Jatropha curcas]
MLALLFSNSSLFLPSFLSSKIFSLWVFIFLSVSLSFQFSRVSRIHFAPLQFYSQSISVFFFDQVLSCSLSLQGLDFTPLKPRTGSEGRETFLSSHPAMVFRSFARTKKSQPTDTNKLTGMASSTLKPHQPLHNFSLPDLKWSINHHTNSHRFRKPASDSSYKFPHCDTSESNGNPIFDAAKIGDSEAYPIRKPASGSSYKSPHCDTSESNGNPVFHAAKIGNSEAYPIRKPASHSSYKSPHFDTSQSSGNPVFHAAKIGNSDGYPIRKPASHSSYKSPHCDTSESSGNPVFHAAKIGNSDAYPIRKPASHSSYKSPHCDTSKSGGNPVFHTAKIGNSEAYPIRKPASHSSYKSPHCDTSEFNGNPVFHAAKTGNSEAYPIRRTEKPEKKSGLSVDNSDRKSKIFIRIKTKSSKCADDVANAGDQTSVVDDADETLMKTWNLRPRRAVTKASNGNGGLLKIGGTAAPETKAQETSRPELIGSRNANGAKVGEKKGKGKEKVEMVKFSIPLTKAEIEEDIYALTGSKPARRPKKRAKPVQKQLDAMPFSWIVAVIDYA